MKANYLKRWKSWSLPTKLGLFIGFSSFCLTAIPIIWQITDSFNTPSIARLGIVVASCDDDIGRYQAASSLSLLFERAGNSKSFPLSEFVLMAEAMCSGDPYNEETREITEAFISSLQGANLPLKVDEKEEVLTLEDYLAAGDNVNTTPDLAAFLAYLSGSALTGLGIVELDESLPSKPMIEGLQKLGFGGMLEVLPNIIESPE